MLLEKERPTAATLYDRDIQGIYFLIFASCEPLDVILNLFNNPALNLSI